MQTVRRQLYATARPKYQTGMKPNGHLPVHGPPQLDRKHRPSYASYSSSPPLVVHRHSTCRTLQKHGIKILDARKKNSLLFFKHTVKTSYRSERKKKSSLHGRAAPSIRLSTLTRCYVAVNTNTRFTTSLLLTGTRVDHRRRIILHWNRHRRTAWMLQATCWVMVHEIRLAG